MLESTQPAAVRPDGLDRRGRAALRRRRRHPVRAGRRASRRAPRWSVTVLADGTVEKHSVELPAEVDDDRVAPGIDAPRCPAHRHPARHGARRGRAHRRRRHRRRGRRRARRPAAHLAGRHRRRGLRRRRVRMASAFDAVETVQRGAAASSRSSSWSSPSCATSLDRGLQVAIGTETGMETAGRRRPRRGALQRRRGASRLHRRARPDPHELPRSAWPRWQRSAAASATASPKADPERSVADLLRAARRVTRRVRPTRSSGRTGPRPASSIPTPTPTTPRPKPTSRRWPGPTRCCATPRSGRRYDRFGDAGIGGAGRPGAGDPFAGFGGRRRHLRRLLRRPEPLRRGRRRAIRAAARPRPRGGHRARLHRGRVRRPAPRSTCAPRWPATTCDATGAAPGTSADHLRRVRRRRPGPAGAPVDPRPDGHRRRRVRAARGRARSSPTPAPTAPGEGRTLRGEVLHRRHPAGGRRVLDAAAAGSGRRRSPWRPARRPVRPRPGPAPRALPP